METIKEITKNEIFDIYNDKIDELEDMKARDELYKKLWEVYDLLGDIEYGINKAKEESKEETVSIAELFDDLEDRLKREKIWYC